MCIRDSSSCDDSDAALCLATLMRSTAVPGYSGSTSAACADWPRKARLAPSPTSAVRRVECSGSCSAAGISATANMVVVDGEVDLSWTSRSFTAPRIHSSELVGRRAASAAPTPLSSSVVVLSELGAGVIVGEGDVGAQQLAHRGVAAERVVRRRVAAELVVEAAEVGDAARRAEPLAQRGGQPRARVGEARVERGGREQRG